MNQTRSGQSALERYLSPRDTAQALGRRPATLRDPRAWRRLGLDPRKIGGRWCFPLSQIQRLLHEAPGRLTSTPDAAVKVKR
jgi:hypothetical protein